MEGSVVQSAATNNTLFFLTTLLPAIGYLLMLIPMHFYNITGDGHRQMMKEIKERKEKVQEETQQETVVNE